ncbi:hypothetical protein [Actinocrispum wychmicini]|uniref:Uncharacterized protein n=1 Tax=Actinocrispum wychmicini TaxID=1213861 RepID=A0A4R2JW28_9PSEU|nr:hypothetical protein [Actinocrispum wychmicini]TCO58375.1 hypothetical protein EV192_105442 [Actinocrispum wychmicini]
MKVREEQHQTLVSQELIKRLESKTSSLSESAQAFLDDILQAVSRYAEREHSRNIREGLTRRRVQNKEDDKESRLP